MQQRCSTEKRKNRCIYGVTSLLCEMSGPALCASVHRGFVTTRYSATRTNGPEYTTKTKRYESSNEKYEESVTIGRTLNDSLFFVGLSRILAVETIPRNLTLSRLVGQYELGQLLGRLQGFVIFRGSSRPIKKCSIYSSQI